MYLKLFHNIESSYPTIVRIYGNGYRRVQIPFKINNFIYLFYVYAFNLCIYPKMYKDYN